MEIKFTSLVVSEFGGIYRTPHYNAKEGSVMDLTDGEVSRLNRQHPGLIEPLNKPVPKTPPKVRRTRTSTPSRDRQVTGGESR